MEKIKMINHDDILAKGVNKRTKVWTNTSSMYRNKKFVGRYDVVKSDRVFQLYQFEPNHSVMKPVSYNSWQAAKKDGWENDGDK